MITGIDHVNIYTAKLAETRAFYCGLLGLTDGPRPDFASKGAWFWLGRTPIVHLNVIDQPRTQAGPLDHVSFAVRDLESALRKLDAAGVEYRVADIPDGMGRQAFLSDPNGVRVELTMRT
jgi:catechol 2,3-dioxygenase-like lactoylglutathione lyase family enzyme